MEEIDLERNAFRVEESKLEDELISLQMSIDT
jgi:hypothetical protein